MAATEVVTYQDMVNNLLDGPFGQLERDGRNMRLARRAVLRAYRDLPSLYRWSYFERVGKIRTVAAQETGTIEYDHTGHASGERIVTLTGATWPSDAYLYDLIISSDVYDVSRYIDSTHIQLSPNNNPGEDVSSGTSYTLCRSIYPAPVNMRRCSDPVDLSRSYQLDAVTPDELLQIKVSSYKPQTEYAYTVRNADNYIGALVFDIAPPPASEHRYDFVYEAAPRPLITEKYETGTVTVNSGSTTVTGSGTTFAAKHVGSIIRFSADGTTAPSPPEGSIEADNPYVAQRTIMSVDTTTQLTIDSQVSSTTNYSNVKYVISDPIDVEPYAMLSLLEKLAISHFAEELGRIPVEEQRIWRLHFEREFIKARIADNTMRDGTHSYYDRRFFNLRDWLVEEGSGGTVIT